MRHDWKRTSAMPLWLAVALATSTAALAGAPRDRILYRFHTGTKVVSPDFAIATDPAGNLYGAITDTPGASCGADDIGCGVVVEFSPPKTSGAPYLRTTLYQFTGGADGAFPLGSLIRAADGTLIGTVTGTSNTCGKGTHGCGSIFALHPPGTSGQPWTEETLYTFRGGADGAFPNSIAFGTTRGTLLGTTGEGGTVCDCGTVFQLDPPAMQGGAWTATTLHAFTGIPKHMTEGDGAEPLGVVSDGHGNLLGATASGGRYSGGEGGGAFGTVFELSPSAQAGGAWSESVLYRFGINEQNPVSSLITDAAGEVFGTTIFAVFQVQAGKVVELRYFQDDDPGGFYPYSGVVADSAGRLYGANSAGGGPSNSGALYRLDRPTKPGDAWHETPLYQFKGSPDGDSPFGPVTLAAGVLYGTTIRGGSFGCKIDDGVGCGTIFRFRVSQDSP